MTLLLLLQQKYINQSINQFEELCANAKPYNKQCFNTTSFITLPGFQLSFHGPLLYNNAMLEKLRMEIHIEIGFSTSNCYILKAHVTK